ncbi:hypothetical protein [Cryptosporangium sp. NPDC051539]|uniref:hypothetical protein n=1 Tax=Cryptosporangium sp. NPDC051539 TaxID=3363962 RepID=UPI003799EFF6
MSDGLRTVLYWLSAIFGVLGVVLLLVSLLQTTVRKRLQETTPIRTLAVAIVLLAGAAIVVAIALIWPHPPE